MRVLVTGTDGYIGIVLASFLLKRGYDVVGLDTGFYRDAWLYNNGVSILPSVQNKDLRRMTVDDVAGTDAVVHLAELSNDPLGQLSPHITYAINHQGSVALAQLCKAAGVPRFVYTSSCSVYGIGGGSAYKTETSTPQPQTAYAECKVLVEREVSAMADATFSPTFLRNATAYGPSPRMRFDLVLNNLAGLAWTTKKIHMTSDGTPWRPLVHVLDICEAIACTLEAPRQVVHTRSLMSVKPAKTIRCGRLLRSWLRCSPTATSSSAQVMAITAATVCHLTKLPHTYLAFNVGAMWPSGHANCTPSLNALGCHATSSSPVPTLASNKSNISVLPVRLTSAFSGNNS